MSRFIRAAVALLAIVALPAAAAAQMTRGGVVGTVRDASGGVIPGVTVTVTNMDTNATRVVVTDGQGFYSAPGIEPGRYTVVAELSGFTRIEQREVMVRPALDTSIDMTLQPAGIGEEVTVTAESPNVGLNRTNPTIGNTISSRTIQELPLPGGRNINNLILTMPNVSAAVGQGTYAVNGNRPRNNNYMVDGSDNNDISVTIATSQIVPEAVAEFQVLQNPYSVEFGRNSGGQVNVITRSGSNRFVGDVWDYYQASGLNSRTNIEKANNLATPPKNIRHQAGGDLGGPIFRDHLFFFGLYQRDSQATALRPGGTITLPTQAGYAALQNAPLRAGQSTASRQAVLNQLRFLESVYAQNLSFRNIGTTLVNGMPIETGQANVPISDPSLYHSYLGRVDWRIGASDTFTVRYSLNDRVDDNVTSNTQFGSLFAANQDILDTNVAVSNTHVFAANLLNEARASLVRRDLAFPENDPESPTAAISGLFTIGGAANFPQGRISNAYQFSNTLTWTRSRHTMKFGADLRYNMLDNQAAFNSKGSFGFNNLQAYMNNDAATVTQALQTASFDARQWQTFFFVQDDFRMTPELTLNLGLRYETADIPFGLFGAMDAESLGAGVPAPARRDNNNWAPRAGFAWSPRHRNLLFGDGQAVIRGGYGIGYDVIFYNLLTVNMNNYPRVNTLTLQNQQDLYPNRPTGSATPVFNPLAQWVNAPEDLQNPRQQFYSLGMQRELGRYTFEVGYSGSRGNYGINQIELNPAILTEQQAAAVRAAQSATVIPSAQSRRLNPAWGSRLRIPGYVGPGGNDVEATSTYNAVFFSANRRLTDGLQVSASYTFSRWMSNNDASLGEAGTDGSSQRPQNMFDYEAEWSRSQYDRPHRLTTSYLWEIPGPRTGVLGQILGGWQISGVTQGQSGRPFTIWTGVDSNGDLNTGSDRPNINPSGSFDWSSDRRTFTNNGYYVTPLGTNNLPLANSQFYGGNAPRNSERGPGFWNTDMSLMKRFNLPGTARFQVRIDAFNVFNQDSYGNPVLNMSSPSFGQNLNNWGRRTLQLGGKISF
jgi:hypothetical protein